MALLCCDLNTCCTEPASFVCLCRQIVLFFCCSSRWRSFASEGTLKAIYLLFVAGARSSSRAGVSDRVQKGWVLQCYSHVKTHHGAVLSTLFALSSFLLRTTSALLASTAVPHRRTRFFCFFSQSVLSKSPTSLAWSQHGQGAKGLLGSLRIHIDVLGPPCKTPPSRGRVAVTELIDISKHH